MDPNVEEDMDGTYNQISKSDGTPLVPTKGIRGHGHHTATKWQTMNSVTDVVQAGMKAMLPFRDIRRAVHLWTKARGHFVTGTERVHDIHAKSIHVTYWHMGGETCEVVVKETAAYTEKYQLPT
ncbi:MAG: hypothetical protein RLZZ70_61 [Candidatus Parcubacteria bacterium]|jgi:hypothetical protein